MKIQGEHRLEAPREAVWEALLDPGVLSRTLPGFESLERTGENAFAGALNIRVGPVQGQFRGSVELSELAPPESYRLKMSGKGAPGFVDGEGTIRLEDDGGATRMLYDIDAQVGGRVAGVGQRLLDSSARVLTRQALEGLERQIAARAPTAALPAEALAEAAAPAAPGQDRVAAAPAAGAAAEPPSQAVFAARMARGVLDDLVPKERRPLLFGAAGVLALALVLLIARACS